MFVNRQALLDNFGQYLKILDNIAQHWQALYLHCWQGWKTDSFDKTEPRMSFSWVQKNKRTCRGEFLFCKTLIYEFHPPLLLSYCQHPHSPPADSPCGIDPGATWRGRHVSGSRYFPGPGWQVILIISWSTLAWKLLSSIVCNSILDLWMVLYKTATSSYFQNLAFLFTCWWWQAVLQCLETFRELPHLKTIVCSV